MPFAHRRRRRAPRSRVVAPGPAAARLDIVVALLRLDVIVARLPLDAPVRRLVAHADRSTRRWPQAASASPRDFPRSRRRRRASRASPPRNAARRAASCAAPASRRGALSISLVMRRLTEPKAKAQTLQRRHKKWRRVTGRARVSEDSSTSKTWSWTGAKPQPVDRIGLVSGDARRVGSAREARRPRGAARSRTRRSRATASPWSSARSSRSSSGRQRCWHSRSRISSISPLVVAARVWRFAGGGTGRRRPRSRRARSARPSASPVRCASSASSSSRSARSTWRRDPEEKTHSGTLLGLSIPSILIFGALEL